MSRIVVYPYNSPEVAAVLEGLVGREARFAGVVGHLAVQETSGADSVRRVFRVSGSRSSGRRRHLTVLDRNVERGDLGIKVGRRYVPAADAGGEQ